MDDITKRRLVNKLSPVSVRRNLVLASMYIAAFELLRAEITDKVKDFYLAGFDETGLIYSPEYETKVRAKHKKLYHASCLWLAEVGAIDSTGVEELQRIREHRDALAHELPKLVIDPDFEVSLQLLERSRHYLGVLGRFWGAIAADTSPDFDCQDIDYGGIQSGSMVLMDLILSVASESDA